MIAQMSEYSLMGEYSLVGCRTLILYYIINGRYVETGNLSCLSLSLLLSIQKTSKKKVYKDFQFYSYCKNYGTQFMNSSQMYGGLGDHKSNNCAYFSFMYTLFFIG